MYETSMERIKREIEIISRFTATPGNGRTCFSYSEEDTGLRKYLVEQFTKLGLNISYDAVGNIRARLPGSDPSALPVMTGSHIDSVFQGGNYDGIVGVAGALEVVRVFKENNIPHTNPVDIIVFVEEEGSNFGSCCEGSKTLVGKHDVEDLKGLRNDRGISMYEMAKESGYNPDKIQDFTVKSGDLKAMIEMHIEQSVILDNSDISIGIVEAIAGLKQYRVELEGVSNHAGATPMNSRKDPLAAAAKIITELEDIACNRAESTTVATVGKISCEPDVSNVIPGKVTFTMDIRDVNKQGIDFTVSEIRKKILEIAGEYDLGVIIDLLGDQEVVRLSSMVADKMEKVAEERGFKYLRMNSGAVHDAVLFAPVTEAGLIFVPSKNGRSHVAEEDTDIEDIKIGCDLLLGTILELVS